jgi:hypothetical protein
MVRTVSIFALLFVLLCGLFFLVTYPSGGVGAIGSTPRPLSPGRALIEIESSTSRSNAINEIRGAVRAVVDGLFPPRGGSWNGGVSSEGGSANYVVWNRLFWATSVTVKSDEDFEVLLEGWKAALIPAYAQDRLRVLVEYQPLSGTSIKRFEFTVEP